MFISSLTSGGAAPALEATLAFNNARLKMLAENIANVDTPHYRSKHLDTRSFQRALRKALDDRHGDPNQPFLVSSGSEVRTEREGQLIVSPSLEPVDNILFHDGTNQSIEKQMSALAETGMTQQLITDLLRGHFNGLRKAIRGTVQ